MCLDKNIKTSESRIFTCRYPQLFHIIRKLTSGYLYRHFSVFKNLITILIIIFLTDTLI